jgi:hypothetical protein
MPRGKKSGEGGTAQGPATLGGHCLCPFSQEDKGKTLRD